MLNEAKTSMLSFYSALPRGTASEGLVSVRHSRIAEGCHGARTA